MNELALFAGAGGGILGGNLLGWRTRCAVEINPYCRSVLLARQRDGMLKPFPIWDDIRTFDGHPWRGFIDIVTGGFPCQDISCAGKGAGIEGERSGLWREMARIIGEVRPRYALVENSPLLVSRGLDVVLADFAALGYDAKWGIIGAHHAGAPHQRQRCWIFAYCDDWRTEGRAIARRHRCQWWYTDPADPEDDKKIWNTNGAPGQSNEKIYQKNIDAARMCDIRVGRAVKSRLGRVADGVARRVDRLKAIGNGQVPAVVALAWEMIAAERDELKENKGK